MLLGEILEQLELIGEDMRKTKEHKVMGEYKRGQLHSGSKSGPVVKKRKQAIAIALSEAGKSRKK